MAARTAPNSAIVFLLIACSFNLCAADNTDSDEAWETYLDLRVIDTILRFDDLLLPEEEAPEEWVPLATYADELPELLGARLPTEDGWGNEFMIGSFVEGVIVVSSGVDGMPDTIPELGRTPDAREEYRPIEDRIGDDMVLIVGDEVINHPRSTADRQRQAVADLRSIGTAMESFAIDNDRYPLQTPGLQELDTLEQELEPIYIRTIPKLDPWGNEFLAWSDGYEYVIISVGSDGMLDREYDFTGDALQPLHFIGAFEGTETDIVFACGQFVQWPNLKRYQVVKSKFHPGE